MSFQEEWFAKIFRSAVKFEEWVRNMKMEYVSWWKVKVERDMEIDLSFPLKYPVEPC